jgi:hypothetical protein
LTKWGRNWEGREEGDDIGKSGGEGVADEKIEGKDLLQSLDTTR